jgi:membrane protein DedA with SNARE-associated domain
MLAAGFSGKVPLNRFIVGTSIGGMLSLSAQLLLGAALRENPAMIIALIACISATPVVMPSLIALLSWVNVAYKRWSMFRPRRLSS